MTGGRGRAANAPVDALGSPAVDAPKAERCGQGDAFVQSLELHPGERITFSAHEGMQGARVMHVAGSSRLWKHWHETYTLCVVHRTTAVLGLWRYRGRDLTVRPAEVMLMQPGEVHVTSKVLGQGTFDVIEVDPREVERQASEVGIPTPVNLSVPVTQDPELHRVSSRLTEGLARRVSRLDLEERLTAVVSLLLRRYAEARALVTPKLAKVQVKRAVDYIEEHFAEDFGLADLARACGSSVSAVCHGMPEALGVTPMELRRLVRIARARTMLASGGRPVDVAAMVGFCDQAAFTRAFQTYAGQPPGRYARAFRSR